MLHASVTTSRGSRGAASQMGVQEKERQINCNGELKEVFGTGNAMQDKERAARGKQCQKCPAAQPQSQCRLRWQERVW